MLAYDQIQNVHLELTTRCNASCPMCARNVYGGVRNPNVPDAELSFDDIQKIFPRELVAKLKFLYVCGSFGDGIVARDTDVIFRYFREKNKNLLLQLHTNGSARSTNWWIELAKLGVRVRFAIDGMETTNEIYRRGTNWHLIMKNAASFINAGGHADWDFLIFKHNEHEVSAARALSEKMGFQNFYTKKTNRFVDPDSSIILEKFPVKDRFGKIEYYLEQPSKMNRCSGDASVVRTILDDKIEIACRSSQEKSIYVSAEGFVFPCCWTAFQIYSNRYPNLTAPVLKMLPEGLAELDAKSRPISEILKSSFFLNSLPESWNSESPPIWPRLAVCEKNCSKGKNLFDLQFQ